MTVHSIIKLSQTVWELWPAQDFRFRRHKYITKKVRVVSLARDMTTVFIFASDNYYQIFQTTRKLWSAQEFGYELCSGDITRKRTKQDLLFMHVTLLLDLIYVPVK